MDDTQDHAGLTAELDRLREELLDVRELKAREERDNQGLLIERDELMAEAAAWRRENDRHRALYVEAVKDRNHLRGIVAAYQRTKAACEAAIEDENADSATDEFEAWKAAETALLAHDTTHENEGPVPELEVADVNSEQNQLRAVVEEARALRRVLDLEWCTLATALDALEAGDDVRAAIERAMDRSDPG